MKLKLKPYQKEAVRFGLSKDSAAFFIDPGMGKTAIVLTLLTLLKRKAKIKKVLIIASINIIYETWPTEIGKWSQFKHFTYAILHGKDKAANLKKDVDIYLINPEGQKWLAEQKTAFDALVIDESSKYKNPGSKRFKMLRKMLPDFAYRYIMTGTPTPNSLMDLFSQVYIVDQGEALGKYLTHFRNRYFYLVNPRFYTYELKPGADSAIQRAIATCAYVLKNTKIAKPVFNFIKVSLDSKTQAIYESMEKKLFAEIEGEKVLAMSAASAYNKCCQMANGQMYKADLEQVADLHTKKIDALLELIAELQGKPLLIGYKYKHDLKQLQSAIRNLPFIGGGVPVARRKALISKWNQNRIKILAGQIGSISHGLNLQGSDCQDVCYFSLTDDLDAYEQFYRRVYGRHGSRSHIRVHHIITRNTVDVAILGRLRLKSKRQLSLLEALERYRKGKND